MTDQIFISYRRGDAAYVTGHINDILRKEFGDEAVFTDVDNIALGVDFRSVLDRTVSQCSVFLAVIGSGWLTARDHEGNRRLDDPSDFVRIEIESALKRNIPVIPLLVAGAAMPAAEDLPDSIKGLAFRNGTQIRPAPDFRADMVRLVNNLRAHFSKSGTPAGGARKPAPARAEPKSASTAKASASPGVQVDVSKEDLDRHRAEINQRNRHKKWVTRLALLAIVVIAAASWFYMTRAPEPVQTVRPAPIQAGPDPNAAEVGIADESQSEVDAGPPADAATDISAGGTFGPAEVPEPSPEATITETVETAEIADTAESADAIEAVETDGAGEPEEQPAADAEPMDSPEEALAADAEAVDAAATHETVAVVESNTGADLPPAPPPQPRVNPAELVSEGVRLAAIGNHEAAIENFDEAIDLDAGQSFFYKQRGASYQALGQFDAAIRNFDAAIRLNSEDINAYFRRGVSLLSLQDYEAAIADFDVVIAIDPDFVSAYARRADAHEALGNTEAAARDRAAFNRR